MFGFGEDYYIRFKKRRSQSYWHLIYDQLDDQIIKVTRTNNLSDRKATKKELSYIGRDIFNNEEVLYLPNKEWWVKTINLMHFADKFESIVNE